MNRRKPLRSVPFAMHLNTDDTYRLLNTHPRAHMLPNRAGLVESGMFGVSDLAILFPKSRITHSNIADAARYFNGKGLKSARVHNEWVKGA